jgi:hypothetical protein
MTKQEKDKRITDKVFSDDRIPSSYQPRKGDSSYKKTDFDFQINERPTRDRPQKDMAGGKENQRSLINIDESEDTFHN